MTQGTWSLALHGGAGPVSGRSYAVEEQHMARVLQEGAGRLGRGESALDVVVAAVKALEASGLHVAGRGASPNAEGRYELDAAVMDGATRRAGAVSALENVESAVEVARAVMERTPHVMLSGEGAARFAREQGFAWVTPAWFTPAVTKPLHPGALAHGTVGAVARDRQGRLAAATSTGGVIGKLPGRVGDTPLIGAGTWADHRVAVSCTGQGEFFIRAAVAADVAARIAYKGETVHEAAAGALADMAAFGGDGGMICVDATGEIAAPFISQGMKRAFARADGLREVKTFR